MANEMAVQGYAVQEFLTMVESLDPNLQKDAVFAFAGLGALLITRDAIQKIMEMGYNFSLDRSGISLSKPGDSSGFAIAS